MQQSQSIEKQQSVDQELMTSLERDTQIRQICLSKLKNDEEEARIQMLRTLSASKLSHSSYASQESTGQSTTQNRKVKMSTQSNKQLATLQQQAYYNKKSCNNYATQPR